MEIQTWRVRMYRMVATQTPSMSVEFISILTEVWSRCSLGWGCALAHGSRNDLSPRRT